MVKSRCGDQDMKVVLGLGEYVRWALGKLMQGWVQSGKHMDESWKRREHGGTKGAELWETPWQ